MTKTVNIYGKTYNTYACICDADTYNTAIYGSKWFDLDETAQAQYLVMATRKIDSYKYSGKKVSDDQPLKFPRVMRSGKTSDDNVLTQLCCQIATYYSVNGNNQSSVDNGSLISSLKEYKIGDLQVNFKDNSEIELAGIDDEIDKALDDWLLSNGMEIWL